ncbi:MAG: hypothetical protein II596_01535, partial [Thermoguttaceae bacterium]|nr:hypothetical protein [Thermoguttaceae bacterium]
MRSLFRFSFVLAAFYVLCSTFAVFADNPSEPISGLDDSQNPSDKVVAYETTANQRLLFRKETLDF